jgi:hypothetical protein
MFDTRLRNFCLGLISLATTLLIPVLYFTNPPWDIYAVRIYLVILIVLTILYEYGDIVIKKVANKKQGFES